MLGVANLVEPKRVVKKGYDVGYSNGRKEHVALIRFQSKRLSERGQEVGNQLYQTAFGHSKKKSLYPLSRCKSVMILASVLISGDGGGSGSALYASREIPSGLKTNPPTSSS